jgi:hypothetical protein
MLDLFLSSEKIEVSNTFDAIYNVPDKGPA